MHLSFIEDAAYRKLLDHYYIRGGPIDSDRGGLFRITGAMSPEEQNAVTKMACEFFYINDNHLHHKRADDELDKQGRIRQQLSAAGKRGAAMAGRGRPKGVDRPSVRQYPQSQSTKSNTLAQKSAFARGSDFDSFWKIYPKKKSKGAALRAFSKIRPDAQLLATILAAIATARDSMDWRKENGRFIPHPATWLNGRGWEDEFVAEAQKRFVV